MNKYLRQVSVDEGKDTLRKYKELWDEIRDLIRSITNKSENYDQKHQFNSDDDVLLNKTLKLYNMIIVVRSVLLKCNYITNNFSYMNVCINYKC